MEEQYGHSWKNTLKNNKLNGNIHLVSTSVDAEDLVWENTFMPCGWLRITKVPMFCFKGD